MAPFLQRLRKVTKNSNVVIDNGVFSLHYGATAFILVVFSILVLCNDTNNPKEPVTCSPEIVPTKYLNIFCRLRPTSKKTVWKQGDGVFQSDRSVIYSENYSIPGFFQFDDEWFSLLLLFEALLFIAPRYFWKYMESGRVGILVSLINNNEHSRKGNINHVTDIVLTGSKKNKKYLMSYFAAEFINALNVSSCIILLGLFFDSAPANAVEVIEFADIDWYPCWQRYCSLGSILPNLTPCTVNRYTISGEIFSQQAAMILPTDIIHQKIYSFLSYWLYMVGCLSYLVICYRVCLIFSPALRVKVLKMRCKNATPLDLALIIRALGMENWFLINLLSKNVDSDTFAYLTAILANKIRNDLNNFIPEQEIGLY